MLKLMKLDVALIRAKVRGSAFSFLADYSNYPASDRRATGLTADHGTAETTSQTKTLLSGIKLLHNYRRMCT